MATTSVGAKERKNKEFKKKRREFGFSDYLFGCWIMMMMMMILMLLLLLLYVQLPSVKQDRLAT